MTIMEKLDWAVCITSTYCRVWIDLIRDYFGTAIILGQLRYQRFLLQTDCFVHMFNTVIFKQLVARNPSKQLSKIAHMKKSLLLGPYIKQHMPINSKAVSQKLKRARQVL